MSENEPIRPGTDKKPGSIGLARRLLEIQQTAQRARTIYRDWLAVN